MAADKPTQVQREALQDTLHLLKYVYIYSIYFILIKIHLSMLTF